MDRVDVEQVSAVNLRYQEVFCDDYLSRYRCANCIQWLKENLCIADLFVFTAPHRAYFRYRASIGLTTVGEVYWIGQGG